MITAIVVTSPGSGYTYMPTVNLYNTGIGYTSPPKIVRGVFGGTLRLLHL